MARLSFTKMHGIGNDYVYVDCFDRPLANASDVALQVSPRHTGIGSDGLILIYPSDVADCRMEMYNADGSRGEMCGNGIRCVGKFVYDHGRVPKRELRVETDAGIKLLDLDIQNGKVAAVTVDMGPPILDGRQIPVAQDGRVVEHPLTVQLPDGPETFAVTCVSMGNPHCVLFLPEVESLPLDKIGPCFERHPFFPKRVNTEFIQVMDAGTLRMRVWERGSGETAACGTGACAALVAAALTHRASRRARLRLNGGDLEIDWRSSDDHVLMTGPATEVFQGEIEI